MQDNLKETGKDNNLDPVFCVSAAHSPKDNQNTILVSAKDTTYFRVCHLHPFDRAECLRTYTMGVAR